MGNFEKLVVLAVLFVAAVVLAISFNKGDDAVEAADPLSAAQQVLEQGDPGVRPGSEPVASESAPSLLLNAGDEESLTTATEPAPSGLQPAEGFALNGLSLEPASDPTRPILTATTGLRPSFLDELMVYTVLEGDTWSNLAQRFYQDGRYTRNLQRANDDLAVLTPGSDIFVPVYDFFADELDAPAGEPIAADAAPAFVTPSPAPGAVQPREAAPKSPSLGATAKTLEYEVKPGDTLSDISLAVFGSASRWKELLEANSDKLRTPESLQVGMKLKIPEGGKLPAGGSAKPVASKPVAKKTETKPAAVQEKPQAAAKKKKVL